MGWRNVESPAVDAFCQVLKACLDVSSQVTQFRFQLRGIVIFVAFAHSKLERNESVKDGAAELGKHSQTFAPSRSSRWLVALSFEQRVVATKECQHILAQLNKILCRMAAKALQDPLEEGIEDEELLGEAIAETEPCTIRKDQGLHCESDKNPEENFADSMEGQEPM